MKFDFEGKDGEYIGESITDACTRNYLIAHKNMYSGR